MTSTSSATEYPGDERHCDDCANYQQQIEVLQELNKEQGRHIARLLKQRDETDKVIARFVQETTHHE